MFSFTIFLTARVLPTGTSSRRNLLLMSDGTVVVSDLGLAVSVEEAQKEGAVSLL
jgi:hypothetical protein